MLYLLIHSIASMILSAISDTVSNEMQLLLSIWSDRSSRQEGVINNDDDD